MLLTRKHGTLSSMVSLERFHTVRKSQKSPPDFFSPPAVLSRLRCAEKDVYVLRDDLLPGGTKQRACAPFLMTLTEQGYRHFVYASPFSGFAQIALASVCQSLNLPCTLFCEKDQTKLGKQFHEFSLLAQSYGAKLVLTETLGEAQIRAAQFTQQSNDRKELPLGFDCAEFRLALREKIMIMWAEIKIQLLQEPQNIWLPVGSGTLTKTIRALLPHSIQLNCVDVRVLPETDPRLLQVSQLPNTKLYRSDQMFHEPAQDLPAVPSNLYYDAKLWSFIQKHAQHGDLWWNVAR